jgi:geranylgeranyl pyrophosphate synthase
MKTEIPIAISDEIIKLDTELQQLRDNILDYDGTQKTFKFAGKFAKYEKMTYVDFLTLREIIRLCADTQYKKAGNKTVDLSSTALVIIPADVRKWLYQEATPCSNT